jgi:hypothetical protein
MQVRHFAALLGAVLLWMAGSAPAAAQAWLKAESPNFVVYGAEDEARLREQALLLEDYDQLLRALTGTRAAPASRFPVYLVRGNGQLRTVWPQTTASVGGFYRARPDGVAAFVDTRMSMGTQPSERGHELLFHEYAHHFMFQYFPASYPAWYVEGFAEFMMNTRISDGRIQYGDVSAGRSQWLVHTEWLDMDRLLFGDHKRFSGEQVAKFYAQSWILVHYLFRDAERRAMLNRYLVALNGGEEPRKAFEAAFGMRPAQLQAQLRQYTRRGIPVTRLTRQSAAAPPEVRVTRLPASAADLLLLEAAVKLGVPEESGPAYLARVRSAARAHPNDPYARRVLAHAEIMWGDRDAAERLLTGLLAARPGDAELLYLMGMRHLMAARDADDPDPVRRRAQPWFVKAHQADPDHFPTLYRYAESLRGDENYVSENTGNVLLLAHQLAPQVSEIRLAAASMMMNRDRFDEAIALLGPLAASAHAGNLSAAAQELLAKARARQRPGDAVIAESADEES